MTFTVPGGIASESLTLTPLDDMIFLKWEEPVEPNGLITQYEVKVTGLFDSFFFSFFIQASKKCSPFLLTYKQILSYVVSDN